MPDHAPMFRPPWARTDQERKRDHDKRRASQPWRRWYKTKRWQVMRELQLAEEPNCRRCAHEGKIVEATVVNHKDGHQGDEDRFFNGELESLCKPCHDIDVQREEAQARRNGR